MAHAATQPHIDLTVTPAWKGWSRPGRASEVDIRLSTDSPTQATLDVAAGRQSMRADLDLQPGRSVRVHIPVGSTERVAVSVGSPVGTPERRDTDIAQSESPILGVGLVTGVTVELEGFHTVALTADDLPRNASAYASVDALILDAPTLGALDQHQLGALLAHAAGCARIVVLNTDPRVRRLLDGAGGCGGRALMSAASPAEAKQLLESSLAASLPTAMAPGSFSELTQPAHAIWNRVAVALAVYFAAALLALVFFTSLPVLLATSALAAVALLALLHATQPASTLLVWSEGESGAQLARYQAWQQFPGRVRERMRVPIPPQLASAAQPCEPTQAMRFDFDTRSGLATFAEFETRLFRQVSLCYAGRFPMSRAFAIEARADGSRNVRNIGTMAWPHGVLLAAGRVDELPALGPGAHAIVGPNAVRPLHDAVLRTAVTRTRPDGAAALWELELGGVADVPIQSKGWLLVSATAP